MADETIGILGTGFLGKEIIRLGNWSSESWYTYRKKIPNLGQENQLRPIQFDWNQKASWEKLPDEQATIILTVPTLYRELQEEEKRLEEWGRWVHQNRSGWKWTIYISSTSVYPNQEGIWTEESKEIPTTLGGKLRLLTETTLSKYIPFQVVRSGGIYGPSRNLGQRFVEGKTFSNFFRPVHRIHVHDLARLVRHLLTSKQSSFLVNAVDTLPTPSLEVLKWLSRQTVYPEREALAQWVAKEEKKLLEQPFTKRFIANDLLVNHLRFQFQYPTYQEGLLQCFSKNLSTTLKSQES